MKSVILGGLTANPAKMDRWLAFSRPAMPNDTLPPFTPILSARSEKDSRELSGILEPDKEAAEIINNLLETAPDRVKPMRLPSNLKINVPLVIQ